MACAATEGDGMVFTDEPRCRAFVAGAIDLATDGIADL
jgi:hypothetical protein